MPTPNFTCCNEGSTYDVTKDICLDLNMQTSAPIECTVCCPSGYYYNGNGCCPQWFVCANAIPLLPTIPCIDCVCVDIPPPECPTCTENTLPISFTLNTTSKPCVDCNPNEGFRTLSNKSSAFMPYFIIDPIINFILK